MTFQRHPGPRMMREDNIKEMKTLETRENNLSRQHLEFVFGFNNRNIYLSQQ